jgi:hypothetical protein
MYGTTDPRRRFSTTFRGRGRIEPCGTSTALAADTSPDCLETRGLTLGIRPPASTVFRRSLAAS